MAWEVEFSDEFGEWWDGLTAAEQKSIDFTVGLLAEAGPTLRMPHSSGARPRNTRTCVNCAFNTKDGRIGFFTHLILVVRPFC